MAHGSEVIRWLYSAWRSRATGDQWTAGVADPETTAWHRARRQARRAHRRAVAAGSGAAGTAIIALAAVPLSPGVVPGGGFALSAALLGVCVGDARRARRLRPATDTPPSALPAPGSAGFRYLTRLDAAVLAMERLLPQAQAGASSGLDRSDAIRVHTAARVAASELREIARRLSAAEEAHRRVLDPRSRAVIDRTISTLTADLYDGVTGIERLVAASSEVAALATADLTDSVASHLLQDAVLDLEARAAGLRASQRALDHDSFGLPSREA